MLGLFNQTRTFGGRDELEQLLAMPCATLPEIKQRQVLLQFVAEHLSQLTIAIAHSYVIAAENHLSSSLAWNSTRDPVLRYKQALWLAWFNAHDFGRLQSGTAAVQIVLRTIDQKTAWLRTASLLPPQLQQAADMLRAFFALTTIRKALLPDDGPAAVIQADFVLRRQCQDQVRTALTLFYQLDAYTAIARFTQAADWIYPEFIGSQQPLVQVTALAHPLLTDTNPVRNDFSLTDPATLTLLTGGNMSGKTTFLKACGIAVYLAHLGLPVPARSMQLTFFNALFTSIHLSDRLEQGYSHFYSELMRIKAVADAIGTGQQVFLIVDELFRGTNTHDAVACSRRVINKLVEQRGCLFMISSHLPEVTAGYQTDARVQFNCFRTDVVDGKLVCRHQIESGTAGERTGLLLLEQTGVLSGL